MAAVGVWGSLLRGAQAGLSVTFFTFFIALFIRTDDLAERRNVLRVGGQLCKLIIEDSNTDWREPVKILEKGIQLCPIESRNHAFLNLAFNNRYHLSIGYFGYRQTYFIISANKFKVK